MTEPKIRLDWAGLQLLAGALYLREIYIYRGLVRQEYYRRNNPIEPSEYWGDLLTGKPLNFGEAKKGVNYRRFRLCGYPEWESPKSGRDGRPSKGLLKRAAKLKVTDFKFDWFHLFAERSLIKYVKPAIPQWADFVDTKTPIAQRWNDDLTEALARLHDHEYSRLNQGWAYAPEFRKDGEGPFDISPNNFEEIEFCILVADICDAPEPKKAGRPEGSGKAQTDLEIIEAVNKMAGGNRSKNLRTKLSGYTASLDSNLVVVGSQYVWGADLDAAVQRINNKMSNLKK